MAAVVADTPEAAREAVRLVKIIWEEDEGGALPVLTIRVGLKLQQKIIHQFVSITIIFSLSQLKNKDAIAKESFFYKDELTSPGLTAGGADIEAALASAPFLAEGEARVGGQQHFYLEPQASLALPKGEKGEIELYTTTQVR